jgi:glutamate-1-semialdehyde 2,1-aminomutase
MAYRSESTMADGFSADVREASVLRKTAGSKQRWMRASETLAGGVSSGLRRTARPYPLYFQGGAGSRLTDVDGNIYLDYTLGWGPNILGNAPPVLTEAIHESLRHGLTFGAQHELEYEVSEALTSVLPCADRVCYASSGTEIVQVALRLARAATGRVKYLKFEGHYHGWDDSVLVSYHPTREQVEASGEPIADGLGQLVPHHVVVAQWNSVQEVEAAFAAHPGEISAIICEPLLCNSGCIPAQPGFLQFLRDIATREGAVLIFDEVITGFRLGLAGAQGFYGVVPDLATYAKAVGAGAPLSVLAGKRQFMDLIGAGKVVHAGTLNGNPMVLASARAALKVLRENHETLYADLHRRGQTLRAGLQEILTGRGHSVVSTGEGPCFCLLFQQKQPWNYRDLLDADRQLYSDFALAMLDEGVLVLPDGRWYLSTAHTDDDVQATLAAARRAVS